MGKGCIKYPKIGQFSQAVRFIRDRASFVGVAEDGSILRDGSREIPILEYKGTVKLHGTNASIVRTPEGDIRFQSRNRVITPDDDNCGFASYMTESVGIDAIRNLIECHVKFDDEKLADNIVVYGEWCGQGIQKGVGVSTLPRMFVVFGMRFGDTKDNHATFSADEYNIYNINDFWTETVTIDFSDPKSIQNRLVELTQLVENQCPVASAFDVVGTGEGIVWKPTDPAFNFSDAWFKVKGEKHSVTKVKKLAPVDMEKINSIREFTEYAVTENRLLQGIDYLREMNKPIDKSSTGVFLSWLFADIMAEESDTLAENGLTRKDLGKDVGTLGRKWFFAYIEKELFEDT